MFYTAQVGPIEEVFLRPDVDPVVELTEELAKKAQIPAKRVHISSVSTFLTLCDCFRSVTRGGGRAWLLFWKSVKRVIFSETCFGGENFTSKMH